MILPIQPSPNKQLKRTHSFGQASFRALVQNSLDLITVLDADGIIIYESPSIERILGLKPEDLVGKFGFQYVHPDDLPQVMLGFEQVLMTKRVPVKAEYRHRHANGSWIYIEAVGSNFLDDPAIQGIVINSRDITEHKHTEAALRRAEEKYRTIFENAIEGIYQVTPQGRYISANPALARILKYNSPDELVQAFSNIWQQLYVEPDRYLKFIHLIKEQRAITAFESQIYCKDGSIIWISENIRAVQDAGGETVYFEGTLENITERKQVEAQLRFHAFYDSLTHLCNRALFMDRLRHTIRLAQKLKNFVFAVLFLDLDNFKAVNDSLGHTVGDQLLIAIAQRLQTCLRCNDTFARLGGDEFAILLEGMECCANATEVANRIQRELALSFNLNGHEVFSSASIGIAIGTTGYEQPEELLRDADIAMYRAKALGRGKHAVFDITMHTQAVERLRLETDLRRAIARQEFQILYQPIIRLETGRLHSFEALLRWDHPERGVILPRDFIPIAEETGMIIPLGKWVLQEALRQLHYWRQDFSQDLPLSISVNLSAKQLSQSQLVKQIAQLLQEVDLNPNCLCLEITESVIMENTELAIAILLELKNLGIQLHIDDFGTGYSSLSSLHRFPIHMLKIDRSFINKINLEYENLEMVRAIVALAHNLKLQVVAEGIETQEHLHLLRQLKCQYGQGYWFSQPLDSVAAATLIAQNPQW